MRDALKMSAALFLLCFTASVGYYGLRARAKAKRERLARLE